MVDPLKARVDPGNMCGIYLCLLTYNPSLAKVKVDLHAKYQGQRSNGSAVRALTDRRTDRQMDGPIPLSHCFAKAIATQSMIIIIGLNLESDEMVSSQVKRC